MIQSIFTVSDGYIQGFDVSGHAGYGEEGEDILCASVSSAVLMAANAITEIQHLQADITEHDGFLSLKLSPDEAKSAEVTLNGLLLHLNALSQEYSQFIKVNISEV
jgi:hypothetical protein